MVLAALKACAFVPFRLDRAAKWRLPSADTVPTQTATPVLPGCSSSVVSAFFGFCSFFFPSLIPFFLGENVPFSQSPSLQGAAGTNSAASVVKQ